ncbi:hypothetical protein CXG81DRAFT_530, partial [Caulochytrium protostelioides]
TSSLIPYLFVLAMFGSTLLRAVLETQSRLLATVIGTRVSNVLVGLVYAKALHRATYTTSGDNASIGKIVNLMSVDATRVGAVCGLYLTPITQFLQIVLGVVSLISLMGWPALAGISVMLVLMMFGAPFAKAMSSAFEAQSQSTDERVNAMNEMLSGIRIIKFFAWEDQFTSKLLKLRDNELRGIARTVLLGMANRVIWFSAPIAVSVVTFYTYTSPRFGNHDLTPSVAFTALSLFIVLRSPLQIFPSSLVQLINAWVSLTRVRKFLDEPELERYRLTGASGHASAPAVAGFEKAAFQWDRTTRRGFGLDGLDLAFPAEKLSVVIGATGAGKSSLILSLLGETHAIQGTAFLRRDVAYVPQQAWLLNATIRDNITFGCPWDQERYQRVVSVCSLVHDFQLLPGGDLTEVGERGINLSGGQKQRIALARAAYSAAEIVLLDDPLSAVDAPTAKFLFDHCIRGWMAGRTRILVTNATSLCVPKADYAVVLDNGAVALHGGVDALIAEIRDPAFATQSRGLSEIRAHLLQDVDAANNGAVKAAADGAADDPAGMPTLAVYDLDPAKETERLEKARLTSTEETVKGAVSWSVYGLYYRAVGGLPYVLILLFGYSLNHALTISQDWWIRIWTGAYGVAGAAVGAAAARLPGVAALLLPAPAQAAFAALASSVDTHYYITVYALLGIATVVAVMVRLCILCAGAVLGGRRIHKDLLDSVLRAPPRFFDMTPTGRIMNRFSKDISSVDWECSVYAGNATFSLVSVVFVLATIGAVTPLFLVGCVPVAYVYCRVGRSFLVISRSLKRIDSVARSPIYSHFGETLNGTHTLRAYRREAAFQAESYRRVNAMTRASFFLSASGFWLAVRIQAVGGVIVLVAGATGLISHASANMIGLTLNFALTVNDVLINVVNNLSMLEIAMNSMERVSEYMAIEHEAPAIVPHARPPAGWPTRGEIVIEGLELRYAPTSPPVLHDISLHIRGGEKVGIVGRTGAGKSSLTLGFFRFVEPSAGSITIDGVPISTLGLADLRGALTIIPQDPVLFTGTVRSNLDPFGTIDDQTLNASLRAAHLMGEPALPDGDARRRRLRQQQKRQQAFAITLDLPIAEGGANLSAGQRQLLCLARAISRRSKLAILDEATANIDAATDARIQRTLREAFRGATLLTVCHRLRTVMDYDRIVVLDQGRVRHVGSPLALISDASTQFHAMCQETGEFEVLLAMAREA